jgi:two-component system, sensor histidine kinase and response regulator
MKKRILIIEDDLNVRENVREILLAENFEVVSADNGRDGYQKAVEILPDLILCDLLMPEMNGYEVIHFMKENPVTRDIPFIFLTAKVDLADIRRGMETGADDYITKPFTVKSLLKAIQIRLEKYDISKKKIHDLTLNLEMSLPHELRTPLFGILGFSKLLADNVDSYSKEEVKEFAENIFTSGKRLHRLIENFLYLARLELISMNSAELKNLENEQISKAGAIITQSAIEAAKSKDRIEDLKINIEDYEYRINLEGFIKIFDELIDNAFKFSKKGNEVSISSRSNGKYNIISVSNKGIVMTEEQIANIRPHMQFERKIREQQGSGLGLSIAKKIVDIYKGKLNISVNGDIITFEVYLLKP